MPLPIDTVNDPFLTHTQAPAGSTAARAQNNFKSVDPGAVRRRYKYGGKTREELQFDASVYPFLAFFTILSAFSFVYPNVISWAIVLGWLGAMVMVVPPFPNRARSLDWCPVLLLMVAVCAGGLVGALNFDWHINPYYTIAFHSEYSNVLPSEGSDAHADAGKIIWSASARVDTSRSVGYQDRYTYCVAPVMDDSDMSKIGYWAVGIDCCAPRAAFWCDEAGQPTAYAAVPYVEPTLLGHSSDGYHKAIEMAQAAYSLHSEDEPMLIRWVTNPVKEEYRLKWNGSIIYCTAVLIGLVVATFSNVFVNVNSD